MGERPVCPMCGEPGIHRTAQDCIDELRAERDRLQTLKVSRIDPSVKATGQFYAGYFDY